MRKYLRLSLLVFISYFASISLAYSQYDSKKAAKVNIKKLLVDGNKINFKGIPTGLLTTIKKGLASQVSEYFIEKSIYQLPEEEEEARQFNIYLEKTLAPELSLKIYRSLLRDELKGKKYASKIVNKKQKTEDELKVLYAAEIAVAKFLFKGTIILLSVLDKEEYMYLRIFLEELQLLATLPPSHPCIRAFLNGTFNKSVFAMKMANQFYNELHSFTEEYWKAVYGLGDEITENNDKQN